MTDHQSTDLDTLEAEFATAMIGNFPPASEAYATLFWRAYLGNAFDLWQVLRSCRLGKRQPWPTIKTLAQLLGPGTSRHTILGRAAYSDRPALVGALDQLADERLVRYWTTGRGPNMRYRFEVRDPLPLLAPAQLEQVADDAILDLHEMFLEEAGVSPGRWRRVRVASLVPPW